jgi:hypothetical protein
MPARKATSRGAGSAGKATTWRQTSRGGASTTTVVLTGRISGRAGPEPGAVSGLFETAERLAPLADLLAVSSFGSRDES